MKSMKALDDLQRGSKMKPTPYQRKVLERAGGLLTSCLVSWCSFQWAAMQDGQRGIFFRLSSGNKPENVSRAVDAMGLAFRCADAELVKTNGGTEFVKITFRNKGGLK